MEEEDYYTLYYISISVGESTFKFHIPYNIGKEYLPDKSQLENINQKENDGMFRFGREITDEELIVYTEKIIDKNFRRAFEALDLN